MKTKNVVSMKQRIATSIVELALEDQLRTILRIRELASEMAQSGIIDDDLSDQIQQSVCDLSGHNLKEIECNLRDLNDLSENTGYPGYQIRNFTEQSLRERIESLVFD